MSGGDKETDGDQKIGLIDVLRVIGGILLVNALLSYWITSSPTWGYKPGKYADPRFLTYQIFGPSLNLTTAELSIYNGSDPSLPIYVGVGGKVYDVTASRGIYGPKGTYHVFAGKDSARAFHNGCFHRKDQLTHDLRGLDPQEAAKDIEKWQDYYRGHRKYWEVGTVTHAELQGEPPAECVGPKYPGT